MGLTKFFIIPTTASVVIPASLISFNSNFSDELVLATYQSYINEEIAEEAYQEFSIKTIYFENDREVFNGFSSGAFDLAILSSSTLEEAVKKGLVKKIDWDKFQPLKDKLKNNGGAGTNGQKKNWGSVYSPVVEKFFSSPEISNYGVPYFLSYLAFAYSGEDLLKNGKERGDFSTSQQMSWSDLIAKIIADERFKTTDGFPKLGMVEDELTLFSLSKLSQKQETEKGQGPSETEKLFEPEKKQSESQFYKQFFQINESGINKGKLGPRPLFLSPDSAVLSEMLCKGELAGAFVYNGDALYAQTMIDDGDCEEEEETGDDEDEDLNDSQDTSDSSDSDSSDSSKPKRKIKIITGSPTLWFLDSIAISAQVSPEKENKIYEFLNKLSFEGLDKFSKLHAKREKILKDSDDEEDSDSEEENGEKEESDGSDSWLIRNFLEIQYTPALKDFSSCIKGETNGQ
ncbi:spermidine/putrescine ABC transporter substrate-binding protein, partial [Mycoplasma wenyonii]